MQPMTDPAEGASSSPDRVSACPTFKPEVLMDSPKGLITRRADGRVDVIASTTGITLN